MKFSSHKRPRNMTIYWLPYTCGALGLSVCTLWLLRHSSLMGISDIDNWIQDAKESMVGFWDVHVGQPIISIRDELFETFKQRYKHEMEKQEIQQTEESLRRMLLYYCENTSSEKIATRYVRSSDDGDCHEEVIPLLCLFRMHSIQVNLHLTFCSGKFRLRSINWIFWGQ
ncbi:hypothetical protein ABZP36_005091 [Zizania latifolia]